MQKVYELSDYRARVVRRDGRVQVRLTRRPEPSLADAVWTIAGALLLGLLVAALW